MNSPPKNKRRFAISRQQNNSFRLNLTSCKHKHRHYRHHSNFRTAKFLHENFLKAYVTSNCGRVPHDFTHDLTCTSSEIVANKITPFFRDGLGIRESLEKQGNFWLPRKPKECAPEFKTLADYVIPRNKYNQNQLTHTVVSYRCID